MLTKAGRAVLVKSKLSAIPVHTAMAVALSPWALKCTRTLGARCAPYHLSKQLNISISKVMKCDNWHACYMIIIQHKITAYSNNTSLIC